MKRIISILICVFTLLSVTTVFADQMPSNIYVSLNGNDANSGAFGSPVKTLHRAQELARQALATATGDVTVNVGEGTYFMTEPLVLTEEDSGRGDNKMIYRSENNSAVISGGIKLNGNWEQHDGNIYKINVPESFGDEYIAGLYINGDSKKRATLDARIMADDFHTDDNGKLDGFVISDPAVAAITDFEDVEFGYYWQWRYIVTPVEKGIVTSDGKTSVIVRNPDFEVTNGLLGFKSYSANPELEFYNSYTFLDKAGEFYYDRKAHTLYYVKGEDESLANVETIIPNIEKVFEIKGTNGNSKVKNIEVTGFTFSHTAGDKFVREYAYHPVQASQMSASPVYLEEYYFPQVTVALRASFWMSYCDNVSVNRNVFCNIQGTGIGMYEGVTNSDVTGNAFYQIAGSAIHDGLIIHEISWFERDGLSAVSARKPVTGSDEIPLGNLIFSPYKLTHGDIDNGRWVDSSAGQKWMQIDLQEAYSIDEVVLIESYEYGGATSTRLNYDILASNDPEFSTYEIVARHGTDVSKFLYKGNWAIEQYPNNGYLQLPVNDPAKYRYVRVVKTKDRAALSQVIVLSKDLGGAKLIEMCKYNKIANNYISDVCQMYYASCPIEAMYIAETEIVHNEIYNAPYSAITVGWGWNRSFCPDNVNNFIGYNHLENCMLKLADGALIYVLDKTEGSKVVGNYLNGAISHMGGLYFDNGTAYFECYDNVVERTRHSVTPWSAESHDISIYDNYTSVPTYRLAASNTFIKNQKVFVRNNPPEEAKRIIENAGVEPEYSAIKNVYTSDVEKFWELEEVPDERNFPIYDHGDIIASPLQESETLLTILEKSGLANEPEAIKFKADLDEIKALYNKEGGTTFEERITVWHSLIRLLEEFTTCGIFDNGYQLLIQEEGVPIDDAKVPVMKTGRVDGNVFVNHTDTFKLSMMADTELDTENKTFSMNSLGVKNVYFTDAKFGDVMFEFDFIQRSAGGDFPGFVLRGLEPGTYMETTTNGGYSFNFNDTTVDVQKFVGGQRTVLAGSVMDFVPTSGIRSIDTTFMSKTEPNKVRVGAFNVEDGVRIYFEINGKVLFDFVDRVPGPLEDPGYFSFLAPFTKITIGGTENSIDFVDLDNAAWAKPYIYLLTANDIIKGRGNGIFAPGDNISYDEWVLLLTRTFKTVSEARLTVDMPSKPSGVLKREDAALMLYNALNAVGAYSANNFEIQFKTDDISSYALEAVKELGAMGLVTGDNHGNFNPQNGITRAECSKLLFFSMQYVD